MKLATVPTAAENSNQQALRGQRVVFVVNDASFIVSHRLNLLRAVRAVGAEVVVAAPHGHGCEDLLREGFAVRNIRLSRWGANVLQEFATIRDLSRLFREIKPHIVHNITIKAVLYGSIAARWCSVPRVVNAVTGRGLVYSSHGLRAVVRRQLVNFGYRYALRGIHQRMIFQHEHDRHYFLKRGFTTLASSIIVPGAGVDGAYFITSPEPSPPIRVLFASRLLRDKGVLEFGDLARKVRSVRSDVRFIIAGDIVSSHPSAINRSELESWIADGTVEYLGHVKDIRAVLSGVHIVCFPSTYGEGIPKILIEAAACGKPIVASSIPGVQDIVLNGVNGILVTARDVESLKQAIEKLLDDAELRKEMGAQSRLHFETGGFSEDYVIGSTMKLYSQLALEIAQSKQNLPT